MAWNRREFLSGVGLAVAAQGETAALAADAPRAGEGAPAGLGLDLLKASFLHGREYFVLRSGRARLITQADRVDLSPAFLHLIFDAHVSAQTGRKERAVNFADGEGFLRSGLAVVLGGFPFTAVGHETRTRWVWEDGIPAVEASWWAGGILVTERLLALDEPCTFLRRITLDSRDLAGDEVVHVRITLPPGECRERDRRLIWSGPSGRLGVEVLGSDAVEFHPGESTLVLGPLALRKGESFRGTVRLVVEFPDESSPASHRRVDEVVRETAAAWAKTSSVASDDVTVREIFDKARFGLRAMVADDGTMDAGIFEYGAQWVRDTSNTLLGLIHAGHFELARQGFAHVLSHMVDDAGRTMIGGGFDDPDHEQFDQMGELLHGLAAYRDWTGDASLIREHRGKLRAMVDRPLHSQFRHSSGMVHNRREFWERTLDDGIELAYQTYVVLGLHEAADMAAELGVPDRAADWNREADRILTAMIGDSKCGLVADGHLIKRRTVDGGRVREIRFPGSAADVPLRTERIHLAEPDATEALPIALGLVDPHSELARKTLDHLETLENARWFGGGYERYHSSGQPDQPGPWTFATCFILRAQHDAGLFDRSRRTLEWLNTVQGGRTGAWFEEIPLVRSQAATAGILPWTSAEISLFIVRHLLGVRFESGRLNVRPSLFPGSPPVRAELRFRQGRLTLDLPGPGPYRAAVVDGHRVELAPAGELRLDPKFPGGTIRFEA